MSTNSPGDAASRGATPERVANTTAAHADAGSIPALLDRLTASVPFDTIDELWLFPTRRIAGVESTVLVLALYTDQPDRRRVATAHFKATRNKRGEAKVETDLRDVAIAPSDRLTRVIDGVLRRLGDDLSTTPPKAAQISGAEDRWLALSEASASNIEFADALERVRVRLRALGRHDLVSETLPEPDAEEPALEAEGSEEPASEAETPDEPDMEAPSGHVSDELGMEAVSGDAPEESVEATPDAVPEDIERSSDAFADANVEELEAVPESDNAIRAHERTGVEDGNV